MLSTRAFASSSAANKYYSQGDYYGSEGEGNWLGIGAKELNLSGAFKAKTDSDFKDILQGVLPNGQILGRKTKAGIEHQPGVDLTFSAPKSFSIQMLVFAENKEKQAMEKALNRAVSSTLSYIEEKGYAIARRGKAGIIKEKINKLVFASFMHTTNRNLEPQAHVHCFLANIAKCSDDKYRSLSFENILKNNKFFGQVFRNELAMETKKLGFEITPNILSDGSSSFELSNIDPKLIGAFSTRRQEIEELCKLYNVKTKLGRDNIVINSRKAKRLVSQDELSNAWQKLAKEVQQEIKRETGQEHQIEKLHKLSDNTNNQQNNNNSDTQASSKMNILKQTWNLLFDKSNSDFKNDTSQYTKKYNQEQNPESELSLKDIATLCVEDVTHRSTVVSSEDLLKKALKFSIGKYGVREIEKEYEKLKASGTLSGNQENGYTSKALLLQEKQILQYAKKSIDASKPIMQEKHFSAHLRRYEKRQLTRGKAVQMNKQQQQVLKHILTSRDKIITVEGLPGVGKSTVLDSVRDIASQKTITIFDKVFEIGNNSKHKFEGIAPTASAAKTLKESANLEASNTIHRFLGQYQGYLEGRGTASSLKAQRKAFKNVMLFVDESSLISTHIMHKLLSLQDKFGFRLVLTGDTKQLGAVEAGKPFEQILNVVKPSVMNIIVRQNNQEDRQAILTTSQGNIGKSFEIHQNNIQEHKTLSLMANKAAKLYLNKDQHQRDQTLLIAPTRNLRDMINREIKHSLTKEGSLIGEAIKFNALKQRDMTIADYQYAPGFKENIDILKFHKAYKSIGIAKDEYLTVKKINHISNSFSLVKENGQEVLFQLRKEVDYKSKFEVFNKINLELQQGLKIIFTKNNNELGLINSETAIIKNINQEINSKTTQQINQQDNQQTIQLQFENKMIREIPLSQLKHIDYGYCVTVHTSQGKTFDNTIAAIGKNIFLNNQQSWLVSLSRHRAELTILSEDTQALKTYLIKNDGKDKSALELLSKIEVKSNSKAEKNVQSNQAQNLMSTI